MAQFDVYTLRDGGSLVLDCQSDLVDYFETRFVVPMVARGDAKTPIARLTPIFTIDGEPFIMATQYASAVPKQALGGVIASLADHDFAIGSALDMLISGF